MRRAILGLSFVTLLLAGCNALSDHWQTTVHEDKARGEKPTAYQALIDAYLSSSLKDPFSAQQRGLVGPTESVYTTRTVTQAPTLVNTQGRVLEERQWAWLVTVQVNAKNGYGAYVGWRLYKFYFRGEKLIATEGGN